jgi:ZIP family zinc transporter
MTTINWQTIRSLKIPIWLYILIPLVALGVMVLIFFYGNPLALFTANLPPIEQINLERIRVVEDGFEVTLVNSGPDPITVAQVLVDDAYWQYQISPSQKIPRLGRAKLEVPYPWVETEPHEIMIITDTGLTFSGEIPVATLTPTPGIQEFIAYGLLGVYVGIIPVGLGMLFFPAMRKMKSKWLGGLLALTVGLLVFLLVDTFLEGLEIANELPGVFQGIPLILFSALITWLVILVIGGQRRKSIISDPYRQAVYLATMIALGIGLHNLGEGLAIGAAFSIGEAALGSFLVIGFMLHNITEGVGIVAPLVPGGRQSNQQTTKIKADASSPETEGSGAKTPGLAVFAGLMLLSGAPAILGSWVGGFAFSPILAAVFFGVGLGAIWQVIVEVVNLLRRSAQREGTSLFSWINLVGFLAGLGIMYLTAFLVKF